MKSMHPETFQCLAIDQGDVAGLFEEDRRWL